MSRVRPIRYNGQEHWFDTRRNNDQATVGQLELLADVKGIPLDDILDEGLTQAQILERIREEIDPNAIPAHVLDARRARRAAIKKDSVCRICDLQGFECEGSITRHHFIPRWLMLELENYAAYAARAKCTIPVCLGRHRDLHSRTNGTEKSIAQYLTTEERAFAKKMMDELREQHPKIFELIVAGDSDYYESVLMLDYQRGEFSTHRGAYEQSLVTDKVVENVA